MQYFIKISEKTECNKWQLVEERTYSNEIEARNEFNKMVTMCLNSASALKLQMKDKFENFAAFVIN